MKILNISAQKPNSTGSGVYMTELMRSFDKDGIENAALCGIDKDDIVKWETDTEFFPVYFDTEELPFPVVGMSDSMPYKATRYRDLTKDMQEKFERAFIKKAELAIEAFKPDLILCHHLYFLTALVREYFPGEKVGAVCHGTDLRQFLKIDLQNDRIKENIQKLDAVFALHDVQRDEISKIFSIDKNRIFTIGTGYNESIFYSRHLPKDKDTVKLIYAGKISEKKGLLCLLEALDKVKTDKKVILSLAGGYSDKEEYDRIHALADKISTPVEFLGKLDQKALSDNFNKSDIFVLPSFFEGLPLVLAEALACSLKVIATDLPGVKKWMDGSIKNNGIRFVEPPIMENVDEPKKEFLSEFTERLRLSLEETINDTGLYIPPATGAVSWQSVSRKITKHLK